MCIVDDCSTPDYIIAYSWYVYAYSRKPAAWPYQYIGLLQSSGARINHPCTPPAHLHCPPWCNTYANIGQYMTLLPSSRVYAIHHTILVITRWCKGHPANTHASIGQYMTLLPNSRVYAIHHTLLVITRSCKGQPANTHASIGQYMTLLPSSRVYAIHHTILVITRSCKGQPAARRLATAIGGRVELIEQ